MIFEKTVTFNLWIFNFRSLNDINDEVICVLTTHPNRFIKKWIIETKVFSDRHQRFFLGANFYQMVLKSKITIMINCCAGQIFIFCLLSLSDREPMSEYSLLPPVRNSIVWPTKYKTVRHKLWLVRPSWLDFEVWGAKEEREHVQVHFLIIYQGFGCCLVFPCWSLKAGRRNGGGSKVPTCVDLKFFETRKRAWLS